MLLFLFFSQDKQTGSHTVRNISALPSVKEVKRLKRESTAIASYIRIHYIDSRQLVLNCLVLEVAPRQSNRPVHNALDHLAMGTAP